MASKFARRRMFAFISQSGCCIDCGYPMWEGDREAFAITHNIKPEQAALLQSTAEHLVARQDGGGNTKENIAAACLRCNRTRHRMRPPLAPDAYQKHVQKQLMNGGWHRKSLRKLQPSRILT